MTRESPTQQHNDRPTSFNGALGRIAEEMRLALTGLAGEEQRTVTRRLGRTTLQEILKAFERILQLVEVLPERTALSLNARV